jgi:hypothetical protein
MHCACQFFSRLHGSLFITVDLLGNGILRPQVGATSTTLNIYFVFEEAGFNLASVVFSGLQTFLRGGEVETDEVGM